MGVKVAALPTNDGHDAKRVQPLSLTAGVTATGKAQSGPAQHVRSYLLPIPCGQLRIQVFLCHLSLAMTDTMWFLGSCHSSNLA